MSRKLDTRTEPEAVRDALMAWQNGEDGARDRLNAILASWARNCLPHNTPERAAVADNIAMTITAGILPYLESTVQRLAEATRADGLTVRQSGFREAVNELRERLANNKTAETDALVDDFLTDYGAGLHIENERWRR